MSGKVGTQQMLALFPSPQLSNNLKSSLKHKSPNNHILLSWTQVTFLNELLCPLSSSYFIPLHFVILIIQPFPN